MSDAVERGGTSADGRRFRFVEGRLNRIEAYLGTASPMVFCQHKWYPCEDGGAVHCARCGRWCKAMGPGEVLARFGGVIIPREEAAPYVTERVKDEEEWLKREKTAERMKALEEAKRVNGETRRIQEAYSAWQRFRLWAVRAWRAVE